MIDVYRTDAGREAVARWCDQRLAAWGTPHERRCVDVVPAEATLGDRGATTGLPQDATGPARTHVVVAGDATDATTRPEGLAGLTRPRVVVLPDVLSSAAVLTGAVDALLAAGTGPVWVVDVPGQPGASAERRPRRRHAAWAAAWLDALLGLAEALPHAPAPRGTQPTAGGTLVVALGSGAVPVLGAARPGLRRLLVSPAGILSARPAPLVARDLQRWATRSTTTTADALARRLLGLGPASGPGAETLPEGDPPPATDPGRDAAHDLAHWLELVGRSCQAPAPVRPLSRTDLARAFGGPTLVVVGEADSLLDPGALVAALARRDPDTTAAPAGSSAGASAGSSATSLPDGVVEVVPGMGRVPLPRHWERIAAEAALLLDGGR